MVGQQLTRAEVIGLAALAVWAGGVVSLASRLVARSFEDVPSGRPTDGDLLATALVAVGMLFMLRELLVAPATAPPSKLLRRPTMLASAVVVTAVLVVAEAEHLGPLVEGIVSVPQGLVAIGLAVVHPPNRGLYHVGRSWQRGRGSALIVGVWDDARHVVDDTADRLQAATPRLHDHHQPDPDACTAPPNPGCRGSACA